MPSDTTFFGLGMLSTLETNEEHHKRPAAYPRRNLADMFIILFAFQDAPSKTDFLTARSVMKPAIENPLLWQQSTLHQKHIPKKNVSYEAIRGELPAAKPSIPPMLYGSDDVRVNKSKIQPQKTISTNGLAEQGSLPKQKANIPILLRPGIMAGAKKKTIPAVSGSAREYTPGANHGQMPVPWPNLPESKYTARTTRSRRSR
jgi:hypothetical protein